jgi:hypothetical protein
MGFDHFFVSFTHYWDKGAYWMFGFAAISLIFFCVKMGLIKSVIFHLIMFPLILNRLWWFGPAYHEGLRNADSIFTAGGLLLVAIAAYPAIAFSMCKKTW